MSKWVAMWVVRRQASGLEWLSQCDITCDKEQEVFSTADSTFGTGISKFMKLKRGLTSIQL